VLRFPGVLDCAPIADAHATQTHDVTAARARKGHVALALLNPTPPIRAPRPTSRASNVSW
jgi:hypothetical protein